MKNKKFPKSIDTRIKFYSKKKLTGTLLIIEVTGFILFNAIIIINEVIDLPHLLFGAPPTPLNATEIFLEIGFMLILASLVIVFTVRLMNRIRYLEGFLHICSFCKKVNDNGKWVSIDQYVDEHSETVFSHGLCPECMEREYGIKPEPKRKKRIKRIPSVHESYFSILPAPIMRTSR